MKTYNSVMAHFWSGSKGLADFNRCLLSAMVLFSQNFTIVGYFLAGLKKDALFY